MSARPVRCPDAVLVRPLGPHTWLARLPNGHQLAALLPSVRTGPFPRLSVGDHVVIDISPADFSHGRILLASPGDPLQSENRGRVTGDL